MPDPVRGQVVKATVVLVKGYEPSEELKKELQNHVKHVTAPYKYPRIVEFVDELPKTVSGKIQRAPPAQAGRGEGREVDKAIRTDARARSFRRARSIDRNLGEGKCASKHLYANSINAICSTP